MRKVLKRFWIPCLQRVLSPVQSVWIARTLPGAQLLADTLSSAGISSWLGPVLEIHPLVPVQISEVSPENLGDTPDDANALPTFVPVADPRRVPGADFVCAFSPHAVGAYLGSEWRASSVPHFAVGETTAQGLRQAGLEVSAPAQATSEGLLELLAAAGLPDRGTAWLISGAGGRELVANYLRNAGHRVFKFAFYERRPIRHLDVDPERTCALVAGSLQSLELAANFWRSAGGGDTLQILVPSERVAQKGYALGFQNVHNVESSEPAAIVARLQEVLA